MDNPEIKMVANAISTITILSCFFLKLPQIKTILEKKTSEGMYVQAMLMEITGFTIVTLYNVKNNYSLMTYMEYPIILVQVFIMLYLTLKYSGNLGNSGFRVGAAAYTALVISFLIGISPKEILDHIVPVCTPLSGFAKVTYIYGMIKSSNADAVSLTTWLISIATNLARLFTVYVDSRDKTLMMNFMISAGLSTAVLCTALYYQKIHVHRRRRRESGSEVVEDRRRRKGSSPAHAVYGRRKQS